MYLFQWVLSRVALIRLSVWFLKRDQLRLWVLSNHLVFWSKRRSPAIGSALQVCHEILSRLRPSNHISVLTVL